MQTVLPNSVSAIIVTLNPVPETLAALLQAVVPQVSAIVVVDNGSADVEVRPLVQGHAGGKLTLIENGRNVGLAAAQNQGIRHVLNAGQDYVLMLDHDSVPASDMLARLLDAIESRGSSGQKVAAAGPVFIDVRSRTESRFVQVGPLGSRRVRCREARQGIVFADILISSGMLIPAAALRDIGMMDDSLFIDQVDTEWCLRARAKGYQMLGVCGARMQHRLGDRPARSIAGRRFFVRSPARHYFFFRNSLLLYRRAYPPLVWKLAEGLRLFPLIVAALLFCAPRMQHLKAITRGVVDGLRGRSGPLPAVLES